MSWPIDPNANPTPKPTPDLPDSVFSMLSMKGKVVCISGAGSGIGFAVAEAMAEAGANVAITYNSNKSAIEKAENGLAKKYGVEAKAYQCDVSSFDQVEKTIQQVEKDFGTIDVFVGNSGMGVAKGILEMTNEEWRKVMATNLDGIYYCAKVAGAIFKKKGKGNFIITSSMSAHIVNVPIDQGAYNASKAAITHLGKSLAREWREFARVNIVSPGFFDTDLGAGPQVKQHAFNSAVMGRQGNVKEIKGLYLVSLCFQR